MQFNFESTVLVSGSYDTTIKCWDMRSNNYKPIQEMRDSKDSISSIIVTNNFILAGCIDDKVRIYDIRAGVLRTDNLYSAVTSVFVSYDNRCYLASCTDNKIRLIDVETGMLLQKYVGHDCDNLKVDCCMSNDDNTIISGSKDGSIYFWDLMSGNVKQKILAHKSNVSCVNYHPKNNVMLSSSYDNTIGVWSS